MKSKILCVVFVLSLLLTFSGTGWSERYTIMKPDRATLLKWIKSHEDAPKAFIDGELMEKIPPRGSYSVLPHINYVAADRNQGTCGNCWAWAGTGVMEIALHVNESVLDRLSVQYLNSCYGTGVDYACCGGWLEDLADFYTTELLAIPWSNTNANWQDGGRTCASGSSLASCASISTTPSYMIASISDTSITTHLVSQSTAINNIKNVLHQDKGVAFAFFLSDDSDWNNFFNFWSYGYSTDLWNPDYSCGHTWVDGEGGGHEVLIVGYNDDNPQNKYWTVLNSWGTTANRPDGLFRLDMDMDYECYFWDGGSTYYSHYFETLDIEYCVSASVLGNDEMKLNVLRKARDIKLASTALGASLVDLYYKHTGEVSKILRADKDLKIMAKNVMEKIVEKAALLNNKGTVSIDQELMSSALKVADAISANASLGLKMAIEKAKGEIIKGTILKQLGVAVK